MIERVNMVKRHTKPTQRNPQGGIIEKEGARRGLERRALVRQVRGPARARVTRARASTKKRVCTKCGTAFETA